MTIELYTIGKTDSEEINALISDYSKRINRSVKFSITTLPDVRNTRKMPVEQQKQAEGEMLLRQLKPEDCVILLDEHGEEMRSVEFAEFLERRMGSGAKRLCFVIGGPYGFSKDVYARSDIKISLSQMTFSHQLVRVIFAEQLYRGISIINHTPYHHE